MKKIIYIIGTFLLIGLTQTAQSQSLLTLDYLTHSNCNGDPIGTIGVTPIGSPFTFAWTGPNGFVSTSEDLDNLVPGTYSVTVTDSNGQISPQDFQILSLSSEEDVSIMICQSECDLWVLPFSCESGFYTEVFTAADNCDSLVNYEVTVTPELNTDLGTLYFCGQDCINVAGNLYCDEGDFQANFISVMGCDSIVFFSISEAQADLIQFITPDTILCNPNEFQLEVIAPNAVAYEWFPSDNLSCSNCPNPVTMPLFNEFYTVIVTDANGCTDEASINVEIPFGLDWGLFPWTNSPVCEGDTLEFVSQVPVNIIGYQWEGPNGFFSTETSPIIPNVSTTEVGIYSVTVTSVGNCTAVADFEVLVYESPIADAGADAFLDCVTSSVTLDGSGSSQGSNFTYLWTNASTTIMDVLTITSNTPETYTLYVTDTDTGCASFDEVEVFTDTDLPIITIVAPDFCLENSFDLCPNIVGGSGNFSYQWSFNAVAVANTECVNFSNFSANEIGSYELIITDVQNSCSSSQNIFVTPSDCVWPGDTDTNKVVNNFDLLNIGLAFDSLGPIRANANLNWVGQPTEDWANLTPDGTNYKHIDTDGNGIINADDTLAISQNWGLTHNLWAADDRDMGTPFYVERDTFVQDTTYAIPVILGETDFPAENVYGIAFTLVFDTSIVASDALLNFDNSWLGSINADMIAIQKTTLFPQGGRIDAGITRIDGQNMTGFGQMGTFYITIEDIIFQSPPGGEVFNVEKELKFKIENVKMIGFDGEEITVDTTPKTSISTATTSAILDSQIQVFPNPTRNVLTIHSPNALMEKVEIFNISGKRIFSEVERSNQLTLNTSNWLSGAYFLKIQTKEGLVLKKIVK